MCHFHGVRRWDLDRSAVLFPLGPFGSAAGFLFGHQAEGTTEFAPLRLVRTTDGAVVWEGAAKGEVRERTRLAGDAGGYANDSLGLACADLVRALDRDSEAIARSLGRERVARAVPAAEDRGDEVSIPIVAQFEDIGNEAGSQFDVIFDRILAVIW